jgi:hypothetical protein
MTSDPTSSEITTEATCEGCHAHLTISATDQGAHHVAAVRMVSDEQEGWMPVGSDIAPQVHGWRICPFCGTRIVEAAASETNEETLP